MIFDRVNPFVVMLIAGLLIAGIILISPGLGKKCIKIGPCSSCYMDTEVEYPASFCNASEGMKCVSDLDSIRRNAMADVYACLCEKSKDDDKFKNLYITEIEDLRDKLGLTGDVCSTMPTKWKTIKAVPIE